MTANKFKERYGNQRKSFNDQRYENETELSKYVWKLKNGGGGSSVSQNKLPQLTLLKISVLI